MLSEVNFVTHSMYLCPKIGHLLDQHIAFVCRSHCHMGVTGCDRLQHRQDHLETSVFIRRNARQYPSVPKPEITPSARIDT